MKTIKNANVKTLNPSESKKIIGGLVSAPTGYYIDGILIPDTIDPNDYEAVLRYIAWFGSGPGGQGIGLS